MPRFPVLPALLTLGAAVALGGCNETSANMGGPQLALAPSSPSSTLRLPPGAPCSGEISRYEAVVKGDLETGNVGRKIYDQIQQELGRAASACSAGKGGEAHAIVAGSKARHGYRS